MFYRQEENKKMFSDFLTSNPLLWIDGFHYGVTKEDQDEMLADIQAYTFKKQMGDESWELEWHNIKKSCRSFTEEEFYALLNAIIDFVYPYRRLQETYKENVFNCTTKNELSQLVFLYEI